MARIGKPLITITSVPQVDPLTVPVPEPTPEKEEVEVKEKEKVPAGERKFTSWEDLVLKQQQRPGDEAPHNMERLMRLLDRLD